MRRSDCFLLLEHSFFAFLKESLAKNFMLGVLPWYLKSRTVPKD
jgi:hypothetical protein